MVNHWKKIKLFEVVEPERGITYGVVQPGEFVKDNGVPLLKVNNLTEKKYSLESADKIKKEIEEKYERSRLTGNEILISIVGSLGHVYKANKDVIGWNVARAIGVLPINKEYDRDWIYWYLKSPIIQDEFNKQATTTVQATLNLKELREIEILYPEKNIRTLIISILSSLDDKIELNLQMNQTLEAMAQTIFKEWFVNFNFPGFDGELVNGLPKGWKNEQIGKLFEFTIGGDWGKEDFEDDFTEKVYVVRGTDFNNILDGNISKVPVRVIKKQNLLRRKINNGDILLEISGGSKDQPTGRTIMFTKELLNKFDYPVVPASFCRLIRPVRFEYSIFLDVFFKQFYLAGGTWEYQNQSTGISNFQFVHFSENKLISLPVHDQLINEFCKIVLPFTKKTHENINQITTLTQLRDSLLPKLMTGKIEVK